MKTSTRSISKLFNEFVQFNQKSFALVLKGRLLIPFDIHTIIHEIGFWSRGGRPEFFLGGLPSGIGGLLTITSIEGVLLHTRGVAFSKF